MSAGGPQDTCPSCGYAGTFPCIVDLVDVVTFAKACVFCGTVRRSAATLPAIAERLDDQAGTRRQLR